MSVCIVAGMHRSGTSMLAKLLHMSGLDLGDPAELIPAAEANPDGYWEHARFVELNDELLRVLGGRWDSPPPVPHGELPAEQLVRCEATAAALLGSFEGHDFWGWKDPRNCLTMPFWLERIPDARVVLCVRNPLEVALSLRRLGACSYATALELWRSYNQRVLESTDPQRRIITHSDAYFTDPVAELDRVVRFLGLPATEAQLAEACTAVRGDLRHSRMSTRNLIESDVDPAVLSLYLWLCQEAGWHEDPAPRDTTPSPTTVAAPGVQVDSGGEKAPAAPPPVPRTITAPEERYRELHLSVAANLRETRVNGFSLEAAKSAIETVVDQLAPLVTELHRSAHERAELSRAIDAHLTELQEVRTLLASVHQERNDLRTSLAEVLQDQREMMRELRSTIHEVRSDREGLRRVLEEIRTDLVDHDAAARVGLDELRLALSGRAVDDAVDGYQRLVVRIRAVVQSLLPRSATILVVSKGAEELLQLYGRNAQHFPQADDGSYAGYHPGDGIAAIGHLEALRARGAEYLLLPQTSLWWLDYYPELRRHLDSRYEVVGSPKDVCLIYALRSAADTSLSRALHDAISEYQNRYERDPSILDCNSGLGVATMFPEFSVFSPPCGGEALPYLDNSVSIVVIDVENPAAMAESERVAEFAVVRVGLAKGGAGRKVGSERLAEPPRPSVSVVRKASGGPAAAMLTASVVVDVTHGLGNLESRLRGFLDSAPASAVTEIILLATPSDFAEANRVAATDGRLKLVSVDEGELIHACNQAARVATGDILVFLDSGAVPVPTWLAPMLRLFRDFPDAGVVGGKLLYPDGSVSQAGGVVFANGMLADFGTRDQKPASPKYSYVREVDFCSRALLGTRRKFFNEVGGFDPQFGGGPYAEVDYCFAIRETGHRVYYQPESIAVCGGTGKAITVPAHDDEDQQGSRTTFMRKWADELVLRTRPMNKLDASTWHVVDVCASSNGDASL